MKSSLIQPIFGLQLSKKKYRIPGSRSRKREVPLDAPIGNPDEAGQRFADLLAGEDPAPEAELELTERRSIVQGIVDSMPEKLSEVLILGYYHRFPYKEIADVVGIPVGTVKSRLHAAVTLFGELYREATQEQQGDEG